MNQSNPERTGRAMTMREIREALGHDVSPRPPVHQAVWIDGDPLMEAIAHAVWAKCSTEGTSLVVDDPRNIAAVAATAARAAVRAETLRDAEEICDEAGAVYTSKSLNGEATGAYELMERFRRKAEEAETATPAVVAPPTDRAAIAERLWQVAEQNIIAEWICCDPINPKHQLCVQGDATLRMVRALLVDDPDAANPAAPLLDAVLAVLGEPTDRAAEWHAAADALEAYIDRYRSPSISNWTGAVAFLRDRAVEVHGAGTQQQETPSMRLAAASIRASIRDHQGAGAQQPETEAHPPRHSWRVETRDPLANEWAPGSHFASRPHAVQRYETANGHAPLWRDGTPVERRIVRETTTYTVEEAAPVAWDVPDARPGTTDYTRQQQAAAADGEETHRCAHTDIVYGRCVLPIPHDGECVHERQPRCAMPSPDGQHSCVLPPNHEWLHADKHLAEVMPNGSRVVWETPTEAPPSA